MVAQGNRALRNTWGRLATTYGDVPVSMLPCRNPLGAPESTAKQDEYREQFQASQEHQDGEHGLARCGQISVELRGSGRARERACYVHARKHRPECLPQRDLVQGDDEGAYGQGCHVHEEEAEEAQPGPFW